MQPLVRERAEARLAGNEDKVKQLHGTFRARAKGDKEAYVNGIADEVWKCHGNGHLRAAYGAIKRISSSHPPSS